MWCWTYDAIHVSTKGQNHLPSLKWRQKLLIAWNLWVGKQHAVWKKINVLHLGGKGHVGAFHQPKIVLSWPRSWREKKGEVGMSEWSNTIRKDHKYKQLLARDHLEEDSQGQLGVHKQTMKLLLHLSLSSFWYILGNNFPSSCSNADSLSNLLDFQSTFMLQNLFY